MMRNLILFTAICLGAANAGAADFNISVQPLNLAPGQSGLLEVDFSTTSPPQTLAQEEFSFGITANNGPGLHFDSSPLNTALDPTFSAGNYIFAGNSLDSTFGLSLATADPTSGNQTITGGDSTADVLNTTVTSGLLAYLPVTATGSAQVGNTFTINLITGSTQFNDQDGNVFTFAATPGLVTITGSAVPEPSAWVLGLLGCAALAGYCAGRRRRQHALSAL
jgi:MYXO-CTERM domain-containing protein